MVKRKLRLKKWSKKQFVNEITKNTAGMDFITEINRKQLYFDKNLDMQKQTNLITTKSSMTCEEKVSGTHSEGTTAIVKLPSKICTVLAKQWHKGVSSPKKSVQFMYLESLKINVQKNNYLHFFSLFSLYKNKKTKNVMLELICLIFYPKKKKKKI